MELSPPVWADNPWMWCDKGTILETLGRLEQAHAAYSRSIDLAGAIESLRNYARTKRWRLLKRLNRSTEAQEDFLELKRIPPRAPHDAQSRFNPVDLRLHLNEGLEDFGLTRTMGATNVTAPLRLLSDVEFELCGYIRLDGKNIDPAFPPSVSDIRVGQRCRALHFLQSCDECTNCEGTLIGSYEIHYAGGGREKVPIVYGQDVRYWSDMQKELGRAMDAWSGRNDNGDFVRLIKRTWQNPRPDEEIQSIDFVSVGPGTRLILFAITVEQ
jgi:tetratricopeptide (TPR) repeat protein